jgi:large subunit ribosomal protein L7/L12
VYLSVPVLGALGIAFVALVILAWRRRAGARDLIAPPRQGAPAPPRAWPAGAAPIGDLPAHIAEEVRALNAAGRKIDAIRLVRAATGLGLAEAKEMVERM